MTKNAALYWATKGVGVNSIHPGFVETQHRLGRATEVAAAVAFLAGNDATFITGSELNVDGGWTAACEAQYCRWEWLLPGIE